jgi:hypothetical protein
VNIKNLSHFENLEVLEALKARMNRGLDPDLYFFRDNNGNKGIW